MIVAVNLICFNWWGLYRGVWRFSSIPDLMRIIKASIVGVMTSFFLIFLIDRAELIARATFIIQWFLLVVGVGGGRFAYRIYRDSFTKITVEDMTEAKQMLDICFGKDTNLRKDLLLDSESKGTVQEVVEETKKATKKAPNKNADKATKKKKN